ncbi:MAG: glycosyltransferase family 39 protein [Patescibacteria group bacterium]
MENIQYSRFYKKPHFILSLILLVFFLKGVFLSVLFPMFKGQDESRHYNTIQYLAEPKEKTWPITSGKENPRRENDRLDTYNFSEEIKETVKAADLNFTRGNSYEKTSFTESFNGKNEKEINSMIWKPYNKNYPLDIVTGGLYHKLALQIEKLFGDQSILVRFYSIRIFSVLLGTATIFLSYFIAKNSGFSSRNSSIIAAIVAFQPKFSAYLTNINYDSLLIFLFSAFTLGGIMSLKQGLNWKNGIMLIASIVLGLFTKGTAIALLVAFIFLMAFHLYKKIKERKINLKILAIFAFVSATLAFIFFSNFSLFSLLPFRKGVSLIETANSLFRYISKFNSLASISKNYWGDISWILNNIDNYLIYAIWALEAPAAIGLAFFFLSKKRPDFIPEKKYAVFLLLMLFVLQFGVRIYDWRIFSETGDILLGTPGRYFLPNLASHIILVFIGIGMLFRKEKYLNYFLTAMLILMFSFSMYQIFDIIMPRFYL